MDLQEALRIAKEEIRFAQKRNWKTMRIGIDVVQVIIDKAEETEYEYYCETDEIDWEN